MRKPKLTPWYPPNIKPVRDGFYEASSENDTGFMYLWKHGRWNFHWDDKDICAQQAKYWRGLANPPDAAWERK